MSEQILSPLAALDGGYDLGALAALQEAHDLAKGVCVVTAPAAPDELRLLHEVLLSLGKRPRSAPFASRLPAAISQVTTWLDAYNIQHLIVTHAGRVGPEPLETLVTLAHSLNIRVTLHITHASALPGTFEHLVAQTRSIEDTLAQLRQGAPTPPPDIGLRVPLIDAHFTIWRSVMQATLSDAQRVALDHHWRRLTATVRMRLTKLFDEDDVATLLLELLASAQTTAEAAVAIRATQAWVFLQRWHLEATVTDRSIAEVANAARRTASAAHQSAAAATVDPELSAALALRNTFNLTVADLLTLRADDVHATGTAVDRCGRAPLTVRQPDAVAALRAARQQAINNNEDMLFHRRPAPMEQLLRAVDAGAADRHHWHTIGRIGFELRRVRAVI